MTGLYALLLVLGARFDSPPLRADPQPYDPDTVIEEYSKACKPPNSTPRCALLRNQLEATFLSDLLARRAAGEVLDPALLRAAIRADNPLLVVMGLRGLAKHNNLTQQEVLWGIEDARYAVRSTALRLAPSQISGPFEQRSDLGAEQTDGGWLRAGRDPAPSATDLGVSAYPGAKLRYFATGPRRWFFTTADSPDQVIAFYSKGGKKVLTSAQLKAMAKEKPDPAAMMAAARSDPAAMQREMAKVMTTQAVDWTAGLDGKPGVVEPRFVVVEETSTFGKVSPSRVVVVFRDELLGVTAVVFPRSTQPKVDLPSTNPKRSK
jgi:hypothetical protein